MAIHRLLQSGTAFLIVASLPTFAGGAFESALGTDVAKVMRDTRERHGWKAGGPLSDAVQAVIAKPSARILNHAAALRGRLRSPRGRDG